MPIGPEDELKTHVSSVLSANYELENEIGRGGMGVVYCARDRRLKRSVAVKVLPPELGYRSDIRQRFLREAETAAQLNHPNICTLYDFGAHEGRQFLVMELMEGATLKATLTATVTLYRLPADDGAEPVRLHSDRLTLDREPARRPVTNSCRPRRPGVRWRT